MTAITQEISSYLSHTVRVIDSVQGLCAEIEAAKDMWISALSNGGKVFFCGNGGSAADAQHLAAELMGRFLINREPMAAVSLTVDTSALTAIGNDYGYDKVFSRQLRGLARPGDVLVGLSTSGNSANVVGALEAARSMGVKTIGLTGRGGGRMASLSDVLIAVDHDRTNHIQEAHIVIGHMICAFVEAKLCSAKP
ncbi:D-sedoheptulose-7-phosphate isomerase [Afipia felis]|uniref:Phosphoheptose isomerase n=2 Tax=Afipia felis TaxID=1035 RepID=A0A380W546_AFIFE|nr:D-sedoheptulose 7-phosphate isomerase [Afipia felis]EKS31221.1 phosphoheptose isomerase [Afipia felis ATCC 53690]SUU75963.1 Phosphoheptose isomerase [Afipia felis]SUU84030.1 Phosphoheptose isomerase [Afipia felis]